MKPCMKVVRQLKLKKKEKIGGRGVIPTNPYVFLGSYTRLFYI